MEDENAVDSIQIVWIGGASCDGCTMSVLGGTSPRLEELLAGHLTRRPVVLHHCLLSADAGEAYLAPLHDAAAGGVHPLIVVVEGSLYDEPAGAVRFSRLGRDPGGDDDATVARWVERLAAHADAVLAIGTCATYGGIPAAAGSITGAHGVAVHLGDRYRSRGELPVVDVPGCAPSGDAFLEVLNYVVLHLEGLVPLELDEQRRPRWLYHDETPIVAPGGAAPSGATAACPVPTRGWINRLGGCATVGGGCVGCTSPGFPDQTLPLAMPSARSA